MSSCIFLKRTYESWHIDLSLNFLARLPPYIVERNKFYSYTHILIYSYHFAEKQLWGLIVHSDRGSQYCSHAYHKTIKQHQFIGSMSGKGNCFDNAPIESFWGTLKNELVYHQDYKTRFTAINDIISYIELYYNQTRIQKGLGYQSPRQVWFDYYRQAA